MELIKLLKKKGLFIAPNKVQKDKIINYFGAQIYEKQIIPQKVKIKKDNLKTLNNFQKLLGDIN